MVRVSSGFPLLIPPNFIVLPLAQPQQAPSPPQQAGESPCLQAALIPRLVRAQLSKRVCSMHNQGATMHKIAHTHEMGIFSQCVLSFERLSDPTSLFPIQLCGRHMIRLLKELVREIFILPNQ